MVDLLRSIVRAANDARNGLTRDCPTAAETPDAPALDVGGRVGRRVARRARARPRRRTGLDQPGPLVRGDPRSRHRWCTCTRVCRVVRPTSSGSCASRGWCSPVSSARCSRRRAPRIRACSAIRWPTRISSARRPVRGWASPSWWSPGIRSPAAFLDPAPVAAFVGALGAAVLAYAISAIVRAHPHAGHVVAERRRGDELPHRGADLSPAA